MRIINNSLNTNTRVVPDGNNVIKTNVTIPANANVTYTATQDCFITWSIYGGSSVKRVYIDGFTVGLAYLDANLGTVGYSYNSGHHILYKGQTATFESASVASYSVYGVKHI